MIGFKGDIICGNVRNKLDLSILSDYNFDYIFHFAAISDTRVYDQEIVMQTNVNPFFDLLTKANNDGAVLVYASSAATYGNLVSPQTVGNECPENPYGFSKLMMDQIASRFSCHHPETVICGLRYFNVYGPGEHYKENTSSMVNQLCQQILEGRPPRLFEGSDGIMRDFVHIEDVIQGTVKATSPKEVGFTI